LAELKRARRGFFIPEDSMAARYSEELREWLPEAREMRLVARQEGRRSASVDAFIDAANGRAQTLTFVETENGGSLCGGYLDVAWVEGGFMSDPGRRSFIFTLKNHLGVPPTMFAQKRGEYAAWMRRDGAVCFGEGREGFLVCDCDLTLSSGRTYEAPEGGVTVFYGDGGTCFRAARWELWEIV
jgi:hypothetical protein